MRRALHSGVPFRSGNGTVTGFLSGVTELLASNLNSAPHIQMQ